MHSKSKYLSVLHIQNSEQRGKARIFELMSNADLPKEGRGSCIQSRIVRPSDKNAAQL